MRVVIAGTHWYHLGSCFPNRSERYPPIKVPIPPATELSASQVPSSPVSISCNRKNNEGIKFPAP